jgi:hypothetical protein
MPGDDYVKELSCDAEPLARQQPAMSRRSMLRAAAGAGAVGLVAGGTLEAALPAVAAAGPASRARPAEPGPRVARDDQVVVHVRDARSGEMDIFAGTSQTRLVDPGLAARLVRAAR